MGKQMPLAPRIRPSLSAQHRDNTNTHPSTLICTQFDPLIQLFSPLVEALNSSLDLSCIVRSLYAPRVTVAFSLSAAEMSVINYDDYAYSSEEDDEQTVEEKRIGTSAADQDDGFDGASYHTSDEDEDSSHGTDFDEYASFYTDYEKYQYDSVRWKDTPNFRKYKITKKAKGEAQKQKETKTKEPKTMRKGKSEVAAPSEQTVENPKQGDIHFDIRGALWYTHKKMGIYVSGEHRVGHVSRKVC